MSDEGKKRRITVILKPIDPNDPPSAMEYTGSLIRLNIETPSDRGFDIEVKLDEQAEAELLPLVEGDLKKANEPKDDSHPPPSDQPSKPTSKVSIWDELKKQGATLAAKLIEFWAKGGGGGG